MGTPSPEAISRIRNEKARRYLSNMRRKKPIPFTQKFPNADPLALGLLERMLAFEPKDRPSAEEALAHPYFKNIANVDREPSAQAVTKLEFEFERRRVTKDDIRELIYREILEYHPKMLKEFIEGTESSGFMYPSAVDNFKKQFAYLEEHYAKGSTGTPPERQHNSLPRPSVVYSDNQSQSTANITEDLSKCIIRENAQKSQQYNASVANKFPSHVPQGLVKQLVRCCSTTSLKHLLLSNMSSEGLLGTQQLPQTTSLLEAHTPEEIRPARARQATLRGWT
ncbi:Mitogen-activated protein kinase 16 [Zea mays]|uniref:Mitogen-activated protein kinase 16 n=1 Tax=Zea mays TaxID=4577 RepID=A0A1D6F0V2_MAIZE|nr:Mitogen-activated protein kinase 16 [Zea mays]